MCASEEARITTIKDPPISLNSNRLASPYTRDAAKISRISSAPCPAWERRAGPRQMPPWSRETPKRDHRRWNDGRWKWVITIDFLILWNCRGICENRGEFRLLCGFLGASGPTKTTRILCDSHCAMRQWLAGWHCHLCAGHCRQLRCQIRHCFVCCCIRLYFDQRLYRYI